MIIALPFHEGDKIQAIRLAEWIASLGHNARHQCLVVHHKHTDASEVIAAIKPAFRNVVDMAIPDRDPCEKTKGMNVLFRRVAYQIEHAGTEPFLWLEPDAVPLHPDWADVIADAYASNVNARTQFMGTATGTKMDAVGVYPRNSVAIAPRLVHCDAVAFTENARGQTFPRLLKTDLFQQGVGAASLADLRPGAVIYHSDKDGVLIPLLRASGICRKAAAEPAMRPATQTPEAAAFFNLAASMKAPAPEVVTDADAGNDESFAPAGFVPPQIPSAPREEKGYTVREMKKMIRKALEAKVISGYNLTQVSYMTAPALKVVIAEIEAATANL